MGNVYSFLQMSSIDKLGRNYCKTRKYPHLPNYFVENPWINVDICLFISFYLS